MSKSYKNIISISIWVLFIVGLATLLMAFVRIIGGAAGGTPPELKTMTAYFGYGMAGIFLSVVSILIRKKLE
ncbi:MAG: hypothetical protein U1D67_03480 [Dehalococcoidia bacterium]|nr:hypothetical protein [Dehalococcoidia bacterium]MDZ4246163.1 hypothetical protein [Dehalococcoidia bacterium]